MTTNQLINKVKSILDEYGVSSGSYQDDEIIDALTVGQNAVWSVLATDTVATGVKHPFLHNLISPNQLTIGAITVTGIDNITVNTGNVNLSANQIHYPLQVLPVIASPIIQWIEAQPTELNRGWRFRDNRTMFYYIAGGILYWHTVSTSITTNTPFSVVHITEPPVLSPTQNPVIPADSMIINYAVYLLLHKLNKSDIAQIFYNAFLQELSGVRYVNTRSNA